jgi:hypothetical protein
MMRPPLMDERNDVGWWPNILWINRLPVLSCRHENKRWTCASVRPSSKSEKKKLQLRYSTATSRYHRSINS